MEPNADIALISLAVMGQNLILNMNDHGFTVVADNPTVEKVDAFLNKEAKGTKVIGAHAVPEMIAHLKKPRRVRLISGPISYPSLAGFPKPHEQASLPPHCIRQEVLALGT